MVLETNDECYGVYVPRDCFLSARGHAIHSAVDVARCLL